MATMGWLPTPTALRKRKPWHTTIDFNSPSWIKISGRLARDGGQGEDWGGRQGEHQDVGEGEGGASNRGSTGEEREDDLGHIWNRRCTYNVLTEP